MSGIRLDIVAIGDLAKNRYWDEKAPKREEYATATLVRSGGVTLLVDPGWPAEVLRSALYYRTGLDPKAVTHVFLTHFDPAHRQGIGLFPKATWWMYEEEIIYVDAELASDAPRTTSSCGSRPFPTGWARVWTCSRRSATRPATRRSSFTRRRRRPSSPATPS